jgi:hypothetical protein
MGLLRRRGARCEKQGPKKSGRGSDIEALKALNPERGKANYDPNCPRGASELAQAAVLDSSRIWSFPNEQLRFPSVGISPAVVGETA